jgi:hypothetical protein
MLQVILIISFIWKDHVIVSVGAACSRDHLNSRLQAAPTGVFYGNLSLPGKRIDYFFS